MRADSTEKLAFSINRRRKRRRRVVENRCNPEIKDESQHVAGPQASTDFYACEIPH
jgi:hypothetical protein